MTILLFVLICNTFNLQYLAINPPRNHRIHIYYINKAAMLIA